MQSAELIASVLAGSAVAGVIGWWAWLWIVLEKDIKKHNQTEHNRKTIL